MKFTIYGTPVAKGRPKLSTRGVFARAYTPEKTVNYENLVKVFYKNAGGEMHHGAVSVEAMFCFPIPQSVPKKTKAKMLAGEIGHVKRPDIDNCLKSLFDALNGVAWEDDASVTFVMAGKMYSEEPRTEVRIEELNHE